MAGVIRQVKLSLIDDVNLIFQCKNYDYNHGIGLDVDLFKSGNHISRLRLICSYTDESFSSLKGLSEEQLTDKVISALNSGKFDSLIVSSQKWQDELTKLGYSDVYALIGRLSDAL